MAANCNYLGESSDSKKNALSWTVVTVAQQLYKKMKESSDEQRKQNVRGQKVWV